MNMLPVHLLIEESFYAKLTNYNSKGQIPIYLFFIKIPLG